MPTSVSSRTSGRISSAPISASSPSRPIVAFATVGSGAWSTSVGILGVQLGIVGQDHRLQPAQFRPRLESELFDQQPPALAHDLQRVRLAPGAVERQHQRSAQPLAQRVFGHERAQLADQVGRVAAHQLLRHPLLDRLQAQLLQAGDLALGELVDAMVGERGAPPQGQRRRWRSNWSADSSASNRRLSIASRSISSA